MASLAQYVERRTVSCMRSRARSTHRGIGTTADALAHMRRSMNGQGLVVGARDRFRTRATYHLSRLPVAHTRERAAHSDPSTRCRGACVGASCRMPRKTRVTGRTNAHAHRFSVSGGEYGRRPHRCLQSGKKELSRRP
jgi:hypothetical protein